VRQNDFIPQGPRVGGPCCFRCRFVIFSSYDPTLTKGWFQPVKVYSLVEMVESNLRKWYKACLEDLHQIFSFYWVKKCNFQFCHMQYNKTFFLIFGDLNLSVLNMLVKSFNIIALMSKA